jgi:hypothetical protein
MQPNCSINSTSQIKRLKISIRRPRARFCASSKIWDGCAGIAVLDSDGSDSFNGETLHGHFPTRSGHAVRPAASPKPGDRICSGLDQIWRIIAIPILLRNRQATFLRDGEGQGYRRERPDDNRGRFQDRNIRAGVCRWRERQSEPRRPFERNARVARPMTSMWLDAWDRPSTTARCSHGAFCVAVILGTGA